MVTEDFKITFSYRGKQVIAGCSKFKVSSCNYPQVYVAYGERLKETIHTFYLMENKVFSFEVPDIHKQNEAKKIAGLLAMRYNIKTAKKSK